LYLGDRSDVGFAAPDCSLVVSSCTRNCSGHGRCTDGACECHAGYSGEACSHVAGLCPRNCSGHGECDELSGRCVCDAGFAGHDCGSVDAPCPRDCSQRGTCVGGSCECLPGFSGRGCEVACPNRCSGHGECVAGACECHAGRKGEDCSSVHKTIQAATMLADGLPGFMHFQDGPTSQELTGPLYIVVFGFCAILLLTFILGYIVNLCRGVRGAHAIPFYTFIMSAFAISDYQLKPNPRPPADEM
jgi:hypothetical protein